MKYCIIPLLIFIFLNFYIIRILYWYYSQVMFWIKYNFSQFFWVKNHGKKHSKEPAVKRHTALPDFKEVKRLSKKDLEVIEKYVSNTTAKYGAHRPIKNEIKYVVFFPIRVQRHRPSDPQPSDTGKSQEVH